MMKASRLADGVGDLSAIPQRSQMPHLRRQSGGGRGWAHIAVTEPCFQMSRYIGRSVGVRVQQRLLRHGCRICRGARGWAPLSM